MSVNDLRAFVTTERAKDQHTIETWNRMIDAEQELERMGKKRKGGKKC